MLIFSCDNDQVQNQWLNQQAVCDQSTSVVSNSQFNTTAATSDMIESLSLNANCMTIVFWNSGCDGNSWTYELITDGNVDYTTSPATRKLKFIVHNSELCLAQFKKERSFDIGSLQVSGQNSVKLIVEASNNQTREIIYNY